MARAVNQACLISQSTKDMALDNQRIAWQTLPTNGGAILANGGSVRHWPEAVVGANTARVARAVDQACLARALTGPNMALGNHRIAWQKRPPTAGTSRRTGGPSAIGRRRGGVEYSSCGQGGESGVPSESTDWPEHGPG